MNISSQGKSARANGRRKHAVQSFKTAAECIGEIERDMSLFAVTRGQFSMIDAVLHTLDQVGRSKLSIWTWAIAEYEIETLERLMMDERLTEARLIIDISARTRNAHIIEKWQGLFGKSSVLYVVNHAKIAAVESEDGRKVLLRGSMNLNFNPRFEQMDVTEGGPDFDLVKEIESELPVMPEPERTSWPKAAKISGLNETFTDQTLSTFKGSGKVWAK
jgi:hypothetical protein